MNLIRRIANFVADSWAKADNWGKMIAISIALFIFFLSILVGWGAFIKLPWNRIVLESPITILGSLISAVALVIALVLTIQLFLQAENTRKQIAAEQFKNAVAHLGSHESTVILGGIHTLHHLATIDESYRRKTLDILCCFIREETIKPNYKKLIRLKNRLKYCRDCQGYSEEAQQADAQQIEKMLNNKDNRTVSTIVIQTIINLLFRKKEDRKIYFFPEEVKNYDGDNFRADLGEAFLCDLEMWDADFRYVDFWRADLSSVNCRGSNFLGARFRYAKLDAVKFRVANFSPVSKKTKWINGHVSLLGAHTREDTFFQYILEEYHSGKTLKDNLHYQLEFLVGNDEDNEWSGVKVNGKPANVATDNFEGVFPTTPLSKKGDLTSEHVIKLAETLGYML